MIKPYRISLVGPLCVWLVAGCTTWSKDGGFDAVREHVAGRLGPEDPQLVRADQAGETIATRTRTLLARPLGREDAVQIALLNKPALQAAYAELGIAEADLVQAGRIPNPRYNAVRTKRGNDVATVDESITLDIMAVLVMPLRSKLERHRFEQVKLEVARQVVDLAFETRHAWVAAVAAQENAGFLDEAREAAAAAAELVRRMVQAGNAPRIVQLREEAFHAETLVRVARARQDAIAARERLARLMGLSGAATKFTLAERLPELPAHARVLTDAETTAAARRLDVQAARREQATLAASLGLTKATRFVYAFELGRARTKDEDEPYAYGWELGIEIPLFDWGTARVAKAEAIYMQSAQRLADIALTAQSQVREAHAAYLTAFEAARRYRDEIVPLRTQIVDESVLRYNGMLISVFELLSDVRERVAAVSGAIAARRDFWFADAALEAALSGGGGRTQSH